MSKWRQTTKQTTVIMDKKTSAYIRSTFNIQPIDGAPYPLTQQSAAPDVSIIIPTYCEEETIAEVLQRVIKVSWSLGNTEIIVVDDGSTDHTAEKVAAFPFVKYLRHQNNLGKGAAIRTGIKNARGKILVIQDADLEYLPEYIPALVKPISEGPMDIVYGSRFKGKPEGMSFSHFVGNSILSGVARFLYNIQITDIMTGQKAFKKSILNSAELEENGFAVEIEITCKGFNKDKKFTEIPIPYTYRRYGVSKIAYIDGLRSLVKLFTIFLITDTTNQPKPA
ncbi:MAG: glycosyltransferase family 2 protein [Candidatus Bathyarchaeota archaeon]|nr:glycosyltransferase family 2 protein [Candidatus Bathyarchaeota archaeon]